LPPLCFFFFDDVVDPAAVSVLMVTEGRFAGAVCAPAELPSPEL